MQALNRWKRRVHKYLEALLGKAQALDVYWAGKSMCF